MGSGSNYSGTQSYTTEAGVRRHVGQMASSLGCLQMIEDQEALTGRRFDFVTRSRPDVAVLAPVPAIGACPQYRDDKALVVVRAFNSDWWYASQRAVANASLGVIRLYERCRGRAPWGAHFEGALSFAVRSAGFHTSPASLAVALVSSAERCDDGGPDACSMMPGYKGHAGSIGCCVEGLRLQCHYQNAPCDAVLRSYRARRRAEYNNNTGSSGGGSWELLSTAALHWAATQHARPSSKEQSHAS